MMPFGMVRGSTLVIGQLELLHAVRLSVQTGRRPFGRAVPGSFDTVAVRIKALIPLFRQSPVGTGFFSRPFRCKLKSRVVSMSLGRVTGMAR